MTGKYSQNMKVLNHIKKHGSITSWDAFSIYHCLRLSARVSDLKKMGYPIKTTMKTVKNSDGGTTNIAVYTLAEE